MGTLVISLNQRLKAEDDSFIVFFELTCRSVNTNHEINDWFDAAHDYTVKAFLDLIQEDIQQEWGLKWLEQ